MRILKALDLSFAPRFRTASSTNLQPKSSNHILPKQSHVPVRWRSWAFLPGCGHRKQSGGPTLYGFAGIKSRRPFLEESGKRLTSVRRAHSLAKLHHLVLGSLFYTGPNLT